MQVINAANEVVDSIDKEELAKFFALKSDPEDEEAEVCILLANQKDMMVLERTFQHFAFS